MAAALAAPALPALAVPGPVTLLVGAPAGSVTDSWARSFAPFLERHWPRAGIAILNRPGEGGLAAARSLAAAAPDGRTIGAVRTPLLLARAVESRAQPLLGRLAFLATVAEEPLVLVGQAGGGMDLPALRALGGQAVMGTPPQGSAAQLAGAALGRALTLGLLPFANAAAARQAVMAGNLPCALLALPEAIAALREGRLVGLGLAQDRRTDLVPDIPTFAEQGIPLRLAGHRGFATPSGTDPALLQPLLVALQAAVTDPDYADQAQAEGVLPRFLGPTAWGPMVSRTLAELEARWSTDPWGSRPG
ncbi:hypothetical protein CKO45_18830 [Paracraurococcus ruber]|uniref:Tripartite tricarboxylate transporter substrate binding protein n=1 Tax=Paracraurococcus ruber TaxID=77675 RepID=A0ABS1D2F7_9PROT|nr:hypothetical protein [Paracraurococcus ruber]